MMMKMTAFHRRSFLLMRRPAVCYHLETAQRRANVFSLSALLLRHGALIGVGVAKTYSSSFNLVLYFTSSFCWDAVWFLNISLFNNIYFLKLFV